MNYYFGACQVVVIESIFYHFPPILRAFYVPLMSTNYYFNNKYMPQIEKRYRAPLLFQRLSFFFTYLFSTHINFLLGVEYDSSFSFGGVSVKPIYTIKCKNFQREEKSIH